MNLPLSTAFTVSYRFWVVVFSFSFISMHIFISFLISSVIWLFRSVLFSIHMFVFLVVFFLFSSVQSLSRVRLFATPWIAAHQASLSITNSRSSLKPTSIESVMHLAISPFVVPFPPAPNPSQHQSLFQWVNSSHEVAKVLELQLQHHSFQRNPRADLLKNGLVGSPCSPRDSRVFSNTTQFRSINSSALSFLHSPTLTSIHDYCS